jgi:DNA-entry nuclease
MPTQERGAIGNVRPSGWHTVKYNDLIDGNYLYNRCHLIGYQLAGENDNEKNLITGTRYLNVEGMLPYENQVAEYVQATDHHVLYRVTPIFEGENLVASGVLMEAWSVEDQGAGVCFCVYVYNCQPGIVIDYATGDSWRDEDYAPEDSQCDEDDAESATETYVLNTRTHKFHKPGCSAVTTMEEGNKQTVEKTRDEVVADGYAPCKRCNP